MGELLLVLMPFDQPESWTEDLSKTLPGIRIEWHKVDMYASGAPPAHISDETWKQVTILFTWKSFPAREKVPNLTYVQLLSAGCGQVLDLPLFADTDIAFCTSNGTHS